MINGPMNRDERRRGILAVQSHGAKCKKAFFCGAWVLVNIISRNFEIKNIQDNFKSS